MRNVAMHLVLSVLSFATALKANTGSNSIWNALNPENGTLLSPILVPRPPGTPASEKVQQHIVDKLSTSQWDVAREPFIADTPTGPVHMTNILAKKPGKQRGHLTVAAHYDSKREPAGFIGAIDSAFPCALLLYVAQVLAEHNVDVDFIFFDGEEAISEWTDDDSIYGARFHAQNHSIRTLVLLDLLGQRSAPIPSWFANTAHIHNQLETVNARLLRDGLVTQQLVGGQLHEYEGFMLDDHLPFWKKGTKVVHLIPPQFPPEWHTLADNAALLDWATVHDWALLLCTWLLEYAPVTEKEDL